MLVVQKVRIMRIPLRHRARDLPGDCFRGNSADKHKNRVPCPRSGELLLSGRRYLGTNLLTEVYPNLADQARRVSNDSKLPDMGSIQRSDASWRDWSPHRGAVLPRTTGKSLSERRSRSINPGTVLKRIRGGLIDDCDGCRDDPATTSSVLCARGVSDIDSDSDTIPDCNARSPGQDDRVDDNDTPDRLEHGPIPTISACGLATLALGLLAVGRMCSSWR